MFKIFRKKKIDNFQQIQVEITILPPPTEDEIIIQRITKYFDAKKLLSYDNSVRHVPVPINYCRDGITVEKNYYYMGRGYWNFFFDINKSIGFRIEATPIFGTENHIVSFNLIEKKGIEEYFKQKPDRKILLLQEIEKRLPEINKILLEFVEKYSIKNDEEINEAIDNFLNPSIKDAAKMPKKKPLLDTRPNHTVIYSSKSERRKKKNT